MGHRIDWMIRVAQWVALLPGAVGHIHAFGTGPLILTSLGLLLKCLLHTPLRWSSAVLSVLAAFWAGMTPQPDIFVSGDGRSAAIRGADGRLVVLYKARDTFALKGWFVADADRRDIKDKTLHDGVRCDAIGCVGALKD